MCLDPYNKNSNVNIYFTTADQLLELKFLGHAIANEFLHNLSLN